MRLSKLLLLISFFFAIYVALSEKANAQIYFGGDEQLFVTDIDGTNPAQFLDTEIGGLAIDTTRGLLFYSDLTFSSGTIQKISLDGTGQELILRDEDLSVNDISPRGIALDEGNMVLYIADLLNDGRILSVNYDGTNPQIIIAGENEGDTWGIKDVAVDTVNNKLYWSKWNAVMRSNIDGTGIEMIAEIDPVSGQEENRRKASVMQVDPVGGKLYWADPYKDQITKSDLDGSNKQLLIDTTYSPEGLQLDLQNNRLFYLEDRRFRGEAIAKVADLDGSNIIEIAVYNTPTTFTGPMVVYNYELATSLESNGAEHPYQMELNQNYPNPFNPSTQIEFNLPNQGEVDLTVYNSLGQQVATLVKGDILAAGSYSYSFDASGLASGIYYYRLNVNGVLLTRSMTLLK